MVPYAHRPSSITIRALTPGLGNFYQVGAEIELTKRWRIEPYFALQEDTKFTANLTDRLGLIRKYYF
jgi:hypothetical protein